MKKKTLTPTASLIVSALTTEDPEYYDITNALEASEERLVAMSKATPADVENALAWLRERIESGIVDAARQCEEEGFDI